MCLFAIVFFPMYPSRTQFQHIDMTKLQFNERFSKFIWKNLLAPNAYIGKKNLMERIPICLLNSNIMDKMKVY